MIFGLKMTSSVSLLFLNLCCIAVIDAQGWNQLGPYDTLTSNLLESYNNHNPPSHDNSTEVEIGLILQSITKLDEFEGTFSAVAWQKLLWTDPRLRWNVSAYDGIKVVRIPAWQIWKPDIILYNSVAERKTLSNVHAMAYSDGTVYHIVPINIKSSCRMDLSKYPYDVQNCTLIWGAWMQDNSKIYLTTPDTELDLQDFVPNPMWDIIQTTLSKNIKKYDCCPETYEDITVSVILRRRQPDSLIASAVIATWMILIVFVIAPPSSGERIVFAGFIFVSLVIISAWLSTTVPSYTSTNLGRFVVFGLLMTAMITVLLAVCHGLYPRPSMGKGDHDTPTSAEEILNERRRRYFRLFDLGGMVVTIVLLSIMTGALFAS